MGRKSCRISSAVFRALKSDKISDLNYRIDKTEKMIIQIIKLKSKLPEEELLRRAKERESQFKSLPGLLQKYYVKLDQPQQYGGIYIWDSEDSLNSYRKSALASSIPEAYEIVEAPNIEILNVLFKLRE